MFAEDKIIHLEKSFGDDKPSLAQAREHAEDMIPSDAQLLETYSPQGLPELTVDLYMSEYLKDRVAPGWFLGGEPGNFIVIFGVFDGQVPRIVVATGNNP